uniref:Uncharacterized protein n=1 Tax=Sphaerodactylus townsendi TaxID=933632 RepID=A0ACB8FF13_9SAUR
MVRTLAQFTIALEDMRELGDAADATLSNPSPAGGAAEETPEKNSHSNRNSPTKNGTAEVWPARKMGYPMLTTSGAPPPCWASFPSEQKMV